jgi:hypothetical protein
VISCRLLSTTCLQLSDDLRQGRQELLRAACRRREDLVMVDTIVLMDDDVAQPCNPSPGNIG